MLKYNYNNNYNHLSIIFKFKDYINKISFIFCYIFKLINLNKYLKILILNYFIFIYSNKSNDNLLNKEMNNIINK
jgi:hypothetical protein